MKKEKKFKKDAYFKFDEKLEKKIAKIELHEFVFCVNFYLAFDKR